MTIHVGTRQGGQHALKSTNTMCVRGDTTTNSPTPGFFGEQSKSSKCALGRGGAEEMTVSCCMGKPMEIAFGDDTHAVVTWLIWASEHGQRIGVVHECRLVDSELNQGRGQVLIVPLMVPVFVPRIVSPIVPQIVPQRVPHIAPQIVSRIVPPIAPMFVLRIAPPMENTSHTCN